MPSWPSATADRGKYQAMLSDETPREDRVRARLQVEECDRDIARLAQKRDLALGRLQPFAAGYPKAKERLDRATATLQGRRLNADPAAAYYASGQKTDTYALRFGLAFEVILRDREHPEHDAAVQHWLHLCRVSGLRTENYASELPDDAELARRFWDAEYERHQHPEPTPSGREVIEAMHTEMTLQQVNKALGNYPPDAVPDERGVPAGARPVADRPWMKVPRVR